MLFFFSNIKNEQSFGCKHKGNHSVAQVILKIILKFRKLNGLSLEVNETILHKKKRPRRRFLKYI
tara:strand:- start:68772 stop:68966 length:195 start_codon:yes stop_codon:yes gene_type:complete